jgi:inner membrane protein
LDNLTHSLTGLALSRAGLNRLCSRASLIAILGANAPDIDVLSALGGSPLYLEAHRHATHSLLISPLVALLPVAIARAFGPLPLLRAWLIAFAAVVSHQLMDWTNIYGTRLLWPASHDWLRLDITPVVDPWLLVVLFIAAVAPWFGRLVGSEIGETRRPKYPGTGLAVFAVVFVLGYNYTRSVTHDRAIAMLEARVYEDGPTEQVAAFPDIVSPVKWRGLVRAGGGYRLFDLNVSHTNFDPTTGQVFYSSSNTDMRNAALQSRPFQAFAQFAQFPVWTVTPANQEGVMRVRLFDLRFGNPKEPGFVSTALIGPQNRVLESSFTFGDPKSR